MAQKALKTKAFPTQKSITKASSSGKGDTAWTIRAGSKMYRWTNKLERVNVIREGIPYGSIETISERLDRPVRTVLSMIRIPQTTYNKKKSEQALMDSRESELIVLLTEVLDYGTMVFNNEEEKFRNWLKKPNVALGGESPESFLDTATGIEEVTNLLHRIEYGNFA